MKITDALLGEHGALYALFDHVEVAICRAASAGEAHELVHVLASALRSHARVEEELLFPVLEGRLGTMGPLAVMHLEHTKIDELLADATGSADVDHVASTTLAAIALARLHFGREEAFLFAIADDTIVEEDLVRLGASWAQRRRVRLAASLSMPPTR